jgi:hypothetical protein
MKPKHATPVLLRNCSLATHRIWKRILRNCPNRGDSHVGGVGLGWEVGRTNVHVWLCTPSIATLSNFEIPSSQFHNISFTIQLSRFQTVTREFQNPISKYNREISDCDCQISTYPDLCISMPATDGGRNCIWSPFRKPSCLPGPGETTMRRAIGGHATPNMEWFTTTKTLTLCGLLGNRDPYLNWFGP